MRARNIKPGFYKNEELAEVEPLGRILFTGLWCMADRAGRLEDRPKRIKVEILPYDDCNVDALLDQLAKKDFLIRYEIGGHKYIQITNFTKHQHPNIKENESFIPEIKQHQTNTILAPYQHQTNTPENPILKTENPILKTESTPLPLKPKKHPNNSTSPDGFAEFWKSYPKKVAKAAAEKAWKQLLKKRQLPEIAKILASIKRQSFSEQWQKEGGQFIPYPATWLNRGSWDDILEPLTDDLPAIRPDPHCKLCNKGFIDASDNGKVGLKKCSCWGIHEPKSNSHSILPTTAVSGRG